MAILEVGTFKLNYTNGFVFKSCYRNSQQLSTQLSNIHPFLVIYNVGYFFSPLFFTMPNNLHYKIARARVLQNLLSNTALFVRIRFLAIFRKLIAGKVCNILSLSRVVGCRVFGEIQGGFRGGNRGIGIPAMFSPLAAVVSVAVSTVFFLFWVGWLGVFRFYFYCLAPDAFVCD